MKQFECSLYVDKSMTDDEENRVDIPVF
jgi:hypothetical protein